MNKQLIESRSKELVVYVQKGDWAAAMGVLALLQRDLIEAYWKQREKEPRPSPHDERLQQHEQDRDDHEPEPDGELAPRAGDGHQVGHNEREHDEPQNEREREYHGRQRNTGAEQ